MAKPILTVTYTHFSDEYGDSIEATLLDKNKKVIESYEVNVSKAGLKAIQARMTSEVKDAITQILDVRI